MEATILFVAVSSLILIAVTSVRFGVDSREGFASKEREPAQGGIVWDRPAASRNRQPSPAGRSRFNIAGLAVPRKCVSATCGA
jgi:hypothetical protein